MSASQEHFSSINNQKFRVKTIGEGPATVIFENGMSDSLEVWGTIPDSVALFAKVFLYDRADIGKSDPSRKERTIPNQVDELRMILAAESVNPPYILVGHSYGGLITRYFAAHYPDEVKGLLLLDPSPEAYWKNMTKRQLKKYVKGGNTRYETKYEARYRKEWRQFIPNLKYMDGLMLPPGLPVILISASAWKWNKYQKEILDGLKNARHYELEGRHHIFKDHPAEIIGYINELIHERHNRLLEREYVTGYSSSAPPAFRPRCG